MDANEESNTKSEFVQRVVSLGETEEVADKIYAVVSKDTEILKDVLTWLQTKQFPVLRDGREYELCGHTAGEIAGKFDFPPLKAFTTFAQFANDPDAAQEGFNNGFKVDKVL